MRMLIDVRGREVQVTTFNDEVMADSTLEHIKVFHDVTLEDVLRALPEWAESVNLY